MLNFITRKYHYFIVVKIGAVDKKIGMNINPKISKFIRSYFFWRGRGTPYFEPYTSPIQETFLVFGTVNGSKGKINRNCLIFLLEFYASINDQNLVVSPDFKEVRKIVDGETIFIYKIEKS